MKTTERSFRSTTSQWAALILLGALSPSAAHAQTTYQIIDLGTLGGSISGGIGINNHGQVTGYSHLSGDVNDHAFLYSNGMLKDLGVLGVGDSYGYGINSSGQIAGGSGTQIAKFQHAVIFDSTGVHDLGTLGGYTSNGTGINDSGMVTGGSDLTGNAKVQAFLYDSTGMHNIGTLGGDFSSGTSINNSGMITGYATIKDDVASHAFVYANGKMTDLGTLGGNYASGLSINNKGQITGYCYLDGDVNYHTFLYMAGTLTDLGTLGGDSSSSESINSNGQIVGYSDTALGGRDAFLYANGTMTDLNALITPGSGWRLDSANGINDNGWITGVGRLYGEEHAYLLRPFAASATGRIALEGVNDFSKINPAAPLGTAHIGLRTPGTTKEIFGADVTLTATAGSPFGGYTLTNVPGGTYDLAIKGNKSLRVVVPNLTVNGTPALPDVTLPGGDADNNNVVDIGDFGLLVNAYNGDAAIAGSGYDPQADFNYDGTVDIGDFGILVNEYNNAGAP